MEFFFVPNADGLNGLMQNKRTLLFQGTMFLLWQQNLIIALDLEGAR